MKRKDIESLIASRNPVTKWLICLIVAVAIISVIVACTAGAPGQPDETSKPIFVTEMPVGYRDWKLISVAHEEGTLTDIRAILGNDIAIKSYREGILISLLPAGSRPSEVTWWMPLTWGSFRSSSNAG